MKICSLWISYMCKTKDFSHGKKRSLVCNFWFAGFQNAPFGINGNTWFQQTVVNNSWAIGNSPFPLLKYKMCIQGPTNFLGGKGGGGGAANAHMPSHTHCTSKIGFAKLAHLKVLWNANACWLVLIYNTLIITNVAKRLFKYVPYILF